MIALAARARRRVLLARGARPLRLPPGLRPRALHGRHRAGVDADGRGRVLRRAAADRARRAAAGSRAVRRRGSCAGSCLFLALLALLAVVWRLVVVLAVDPDDDAWFPLLVALPAQLDVFAGGMALAVVSAAGLDGRARPPPRRVARLGAGRGRLRGRRPLAPGRSRRRGCSSSTSSRASSRSRCSPPRCSAPAAAGPSAGCSAWRPLAWVGLVSYGLYLWHLDVLRELADRDAAGRRDRRARLVAGARARRRELVPRRAPRPAAGTPRGGPPARGPDRRPPGARDRGDGRAMTRVHGDSCGGRRRGRGRAARRPDGAGVRARRLLPGRAAVGGARRRRARGRRGARRAASAAALGAGPDRRRRAGRAARLDAAVALVGAARRRRRSRTRERLDALPRGAAGRRGAAPRPLGERHGAGARGRRRRRDRLRARRARAARPGRPGRLPHRDGPARAAAHVLERDRRARGDGDRARAPASPATRRDRARMRALAAAAAAPLGAGLALSFSRGAIVAAIVGLAVLLAMAPGGVQLRAALLVAAAAALAGVLAALLPAVHEVTGPLGRRESQGVALLAGLLLVAVAAAAAASRLAAARSGRAAARRAPGGGRGGARRRAWRSWPARPRSRAGRQRTGAGATRGPSRQHGLQPLLVLAGRAARASRTRRCAGHGAGLVRHALAARAHDPGGRARRPLARARDGGRAGPRRAAPARRVPRRRRGLRRACAAGWRREPWRARWPRSRSGAPHSALDWDWEMPAGVTLSAILLAGLVIALASPTSPARASATRLGRGARRAAASSGSSPS